MIHTARLKLLIAEHGRTIAIALSIVGLLALVSAGWLVANPATTTVTHEVDEAHVDVTTTTSAVVDGEDSMWEPGTELEDQTVYLVHATPNLTIEPRTEVPEDQEVDVSKELTLETSVVHDGEVIWSLREPLVAESETVTDGEFSAAAELSAPELSERIDEVVNQSAGVGTVETELALTVTYDTGQYEDTISSTTPLHVSERAYWLEQPLEGSQTHTTPVEETVTESPNSLYVAVLTVGGLAALVGAMAVAYRYRQPVDIERLREQLYRHRFDEWISNGTLPSLFEYEYVYMDSLRELVDVAIDNNRRVIYDQTRDAYAIITEDVAYFYTRSGSWKPFASLFDRDDGEAIDIEEVFDREGLTEDELDQQVAEHADVLVFGQDGSEESSEELVPYDEDRTDGEPPARDDADE